MTERLYQRDSYLKEFEAVVTRIVPEERAVVLDRTAFYPGGGGQPSDTGRLGRRQSHWLPRRRGRDIAFA